MGILILYMGRSGKYLPASHATFPKVFRFLDRKEGRQDELIQAFWRTYGRRGTFSTLAKIRGCWV